MPLRSNCCWRYSDRWSPYLSTSMVASRQTCWASGHVRSIIVRAFVLRLSIATPEQTWPQSLFLLSSVFDKLDTILTNHLKDVVSRVDIIL